MSEIIHEKIRKWCSHSTEILDQTGFAVEDLDYFVKLNPDKYLQLLDSLKIYNLIEIELNEIVDIKAKLHIPLLYSTGPKKDNKFNLKDISEEMDFSPPKFVLEKLNKTHFESLVLDSLIKINVSTEALSLPNSNYDLLYVTYPEKNSSEKEWNRFLELSKKY